MTDKINVRRRISVGEMGDCFSFHGVVPLPPLLSRLRFVVAPCGLSRTSLFCFALDAIHSNGVTR